MRVLCTWFPSPRFPRSAWLGSVVCAFGFPAIIFLSVADEILFSYNAGALWSVLSVDLFIDYFPSAVKSVLPWLATILLIKDAVFRMENHWSLRAPIASLVPVSITTVREPGSIPSARIPQTCTGIFLWAFWKRDGSLNQKLRRELSVSQRPWGTRWH